MYSVYVCTDVIVREYESVCGRGQGVAGGRGGWGGGGGGAGWMGDRGILFMQM